MNSALPALVTCAAFGAVIVLLAFRLNDAQQALQLCLSSVGG